MTVSSFSVGSLVLAAGVLAASAGSSAAASYYLHADEPSSQAWNNVAAWFNDPAGGTALSGTNTLVMPAHDFFSNGYQIRGGKDSGATGDSTFLGKSLTLNSNLLIKTGIAGNGLYLTNLTLLAGSSVSQGNEYANTNLNVTNLTVSGTASLNTTTATRGYTLIASKVTGAGDLAVVGVGTRHLRFTDATQYTGAISVGTAAVNVWFDTDLVSGGRFVVAADSTAKINLDHTLQFQGLQIGNDVLAPGTYTSETLGRIYGTSLFPLLANPGSITVIPEPSLLSLSLAGLAILRRGRRRR